MTDTLTELVAVSVADVCALQRVMKNTDDPGDFTVASEFVRKCEAALATIQPDVMVAARCQSCLAECVSDERLCFRCDAQMRDAAAIARHAAPEDSGFVRDGGHVMTGKSSPLSANFIPSHKAAEHMRKAAALARHDTEKQDRTERHSESSLENTNDDTHHGGRTRGMAGGSADGGFDSGRHNRGWTGRDSTAAHDAGFLHPQRAGTAHQGSGDGTSAEAVGVAALARHAGEVGELPYVWMLRKDHTAAIAAAEARGGERERARCVAALTPKLFQEAVLTASAVSWDGLSRITDGVVGVRHIVDNITGGPHAE